MYFIFQCFDAVGWVTSMASPSESLLHHLSVTMKKIVQLRKNRMYKCQMSLIMRGLF